ncbi:MAG: multiple sugar transport system ATP-binding protein [Actinomycetota bacterium]|jgi:multiple sugar transport system ATP-binding protein|nr:multiple sugar transport system ATP-binding protein [Actinomycetota bacterium]
MAEIDLVDVTKRFPDGTTAVNDVTFTIKDGEFFILVGPSGCGKSTLLNMIVGLEEISEGQLKVDGKVVNDVDPKDRNMAMVFQSYALYPHMTVRENISFPLRLAKMGDDEIAKRVDEAAQILQLTELLDRKPANLSGGQRQRVAMGRAIVREPAAFLMDEPLSNLDAKLRVQTRTQIAALQDRLKTTTVYVTHDQTEAMTLGDRIALMRKGVVQQLGTPRELYEQPRNLFVAGFIGSPAMNFLRAEVSGSRVKLPMVELDLPDGAVAGGGGSGRSLIAGIRPENFEDAALVAAEDLVHGPTFTAKIDLVEWMGSELYVYFTVGGGAAATELGRHADLSADDVRASGDGTQVVARLERASEARPGEELKLWLDARALHLFDPDTGERLSRHPREASSPGPPPADPPAPAQAQAAAAPDPPPPADAPTG